MKFGSDFLTTLYCATNFSPSKVLREIEKFPSSTRPCLVDTDQGKAILKAANNPASPSSIISELVCAELGSWFGLKIPDFFIFNALNLDIQLGTTQNIFMPPAFASKYESANTRDVSGRMLANLSNPEDIAKLVVFDTWIRNTDRYDEVSEHHNSDNYLLRQIGNSAKYELIVIDHSHCFSEDSLNDINDWEELTLDNTVFGIFPEFQPYLSKTNVEKALEKLSSLGSEHVTEILNSIPVELGLRMTTKDSLQKFICERASFLVENFADNIFDQIELVVR